MYLIGITRIFFGLVMYSASAYCRMPVVIGVISLLIILKGMLVLALDLARVKAVIAWMERRSPLMVRIMSLFAIVIGALIVYAAY